MPATQRLILKVAVDATLHRRVNSWVVTFSVMLATFMEILDTTAVNVSIPHIAGNLSATVEEGTWVVTSYLVSNAIVLPISGWPANYMGRRQLWHRHHDRVSHAAHASTPESLDGESAGGTPGNDPNVAGVTTLVSCERKRQLQASRKALGALYGMVQRHATMLSFVEAFWIMAILFVAMLPLLLLLRRRKVPTRAPAQPAEVSPERVLMEKPSEEEKEEEPALVH